jgi:hypothetical protein
MLLLVALGIPEAGEMVELIYMFTSDLVMRDAAWTLRFGRGATDLVSALESTVAAWSGRADNRASTTVARAGAL